MAHPQVPTQLTCVAMADIQGALQCLFLHNQLMSLLFISVDAQWQS